MASWASLFACVHAHLTEGGLFVLDVNTVGELQRLGEEPPWVYDFDGRHRHHRRDVRPRPRRRRASPTGTSASSSGSPTPATSSTTSASASSALPLERVRGLLSGWFDLLEEVDEDGLAATDTSVKAYYALRRRD